MSSQDSDSNYPEEIESKCDCCERIIYYAVDIRGNCSTIDCCEILCYRCCYYDGCNNYCEKCRDNMIDNGEWIEGQ